MSKAEQIARMVDMLPAEDQVLILEVVKRFVLAHDPGNIMASAGNLEAPTEEKR